jgi:Ni,Fe-hydrogenase III small subunit
MLEILKQIARTGIVSEPLPAPADEGREREALQAAILNIMGRALCIRHVDAGSCNGCELEIHALNNPYLNIEGAGIKFVASPRHADLLLVTGPVSKHMASALQRTFDAVPAPKLVVAVGDCGCSGGIFGESYASCGRISNIIPVDVTVDGCPPSPLRILRGILGAITAPRSAGQTSPGRG